jgi:glycosyltransferase family 2 candidate b-glycosyltransferase
MVQPNVSVIMAEYNTNNVDLKVAIKSILNQTYRDFEFIIVDDGGKNDLAAIKKELGNDKRIRIIKNPENRGLVYSLNNAIAHANGEYLVRMDTDDIAEKNRIKTLYEYSKKHPEFAVVSSRAMEFSGDENYGTIGSRGEKTRREIMRGDVPVHAAAIIKKADIQQIGGYKDYNRAEDLALWCDLLLANKRMYMIDNILYLYRVNPNDYRKRRLRHRGGELKARLHYYPLLGAGPIEYIRIIKSILAGMAPTWMIRLYRNKRLQGRK